MRQTFFQVSNYLEFVHIGSDCSAEKSPRSLRSRLVKKPKPSEKVTFQGTPGFFGVQESQKKRLKHVQNNQLKKHICQ